MPVKQSYLPGDVMVGIGFADYRGLLRDQFITGQRMVYLAQPIDHLGRATGRHRATH